MPESEPSLLAMLDEDKAILDWYTRIGFSFGHIFNDIAASAWFSYGLLFYKLSFGHIGHMFIVFAQVSDAIITVSLAFVLDSDPICSLHRCLHKLFNRFGRYKTFYAIGTILLWLTYPYEITDLNLMFEHDHALLFTILFVAIFLSQVGWTIAQLSHLSMINSISFNSADRIWLSSLRQAASIYSALLVYILFWMTLADTDSEIMSRNDIIVFSNNCFWLTIMGMVHSVAFWYMVDERRLAREKQLVYRSKSDKNLSVDKTNQSPTTSSRPMDSYSNWDWLKNPIFYQIAFIYMCSRLYITLTMAYTPLYLQETLFLPKTSIAIIPFIIYASALVMSIASQFIENKLGNSIHMFIGFVLGIISSVWIMFGSCDNDSYKHWQIYAIAVLLGCSSTIFKISSISLVAHMIGHNINSVSFVYGTISVLEKIASGIAIALIEEFDHQHQQYQQQQQEQQQQHHHQQYQQPQQYLLSTTTTATMVINDNDNGTQQYRPLTMYECRDKNWPNLTMDPNHNVWRDQFGRARVANIYYQYILSYGNSLILTSLFGMVLSMVRVDLRKS